MDWDGKMEAMWSTDYKADMERHRKNHLKRVCFRHIGRVSSSDFAICATVILRISTLLPEVVM